MHRYNSCTIYSPSIIHDTRQAHARLGYHGKREVFSDVAIVGCNEDGDGLVEWYGQVRMFFSCLGLDGTEHKLAFVRWYDIAGRAPTPFEASTYLQWQCGIGKKGDGPDCYGIMDVNLIDRTVLVHADPCNKERFFLNRYLRVS